MTADLGAAPARRRRGDPAALATLLPDRGRGQEISRRELATAMPPGARRPRSRRELMRAFHADPRLAQLRADHAENVVATMQLAARSASWADSDRDPRATTRPTRSWLALRARYSISTWKACRRVLEAWGWLFLVRRGRTERARRMSAAAGLQYQGNDAAVYGLAIPRLPRDLRAKTPAPTPAPRSTALTRPPTRGAVIAPNPASAVDTGEGQQQGMTGLRPDSPPKPADLRAVLPGDGLKKLTDRAVFACWRPFRDALWSPAEWLHAVAHWPNGARHDISGQVIRYPAAWLRWACSLWMDEHGRPVLPPALEHQAAAAAGRVRRARLLETERAAIAARLDPDPTDAAPHFQQLRAERGWRRPRVGGDVDDGGANDPDRRSG